MTYVACTGSNMIHRNKCSAINTVTTNIESKCRGKGKREVNDCTISGSEIDVVDPNIYWVNNKTWSHVHAQNRRNSMKLRTLTLTITSAAGGNTGTGICVRKKYCTYLNFSCYSEMSHCISEEGCFRMHK